jgi:DNA-binding ferritin-like protein
MEELFLQALELQNNLLGASRLAHWNIVGKDFYQFHLLFERIYGMVEAKVDTLAEQARGAGVEISSRIFNSVPELDWATSLDLCEKLQTINNDFKGGLERLRDEAEDMRNYGAVNVIEDILSDCNIIGYMLNSILEEL